MVITRTRAGIAILASTAVITSVGCSSSSEPTSDGPITLQYWSWAPGIEDIVEIWNDAHPDIQVEVNTSVGGADIVSKLSAAKEAGDLPDVSNTTYENLPNLIVNGIASDITDGFNDYEDKVAKSAWDLTTFGDASYAVPQGTSPQFLFYRTDIFEEAGVTPPRTWEEYEEAARVIHEQDSARYLSTFASNDAPLFAALSQQAGDHWWTNNGDAWSVDIQGEGSTHVADYWQNLVDEDLVATYKTWTPEWQAALADGTLVSWLSAVWAPPLITQNAPETAGLWGAVRIPQWNDATSPAAGVLGGSGTIVTTGTEHPEEALEFAIWLNNSEEALTAYIENASIWPANLEGRDLPALRDQTPAALSTEGENFYDLASEIDEETVEVTWGPNVASAFSTFSDEFSSAITSGSPFSDALADVENSVIAEMEKIGFTVE